jgi:hypothetical protein
VDVYRKGQRLDTLRVVPDGKDSKRMYSKGVSEARKAAKSGGRAMEPADIIAHLDVQTKAYMYQTLRDGVAAAVTQYLSGTDA